MQNSNTDKTMDQRFLNEFKATCKNSGESELKQQKLQCEKSFRSVMLHVITVMANRSLYELDEKNINLCIGAI